MTDSQEQKEEILRTFSWRVGNAADAAGLSQVEVAEKLGVSRSRVGNWFQGLNFPKKGERVALAKLLGVTLDWLIEGRTENDSTSPQGVAEARAQFGGPPVREVPVISWTHAGEAVDYQEMPKHFQGRVSTSATDIRAFAVKVEGDSMEPKVFAGDLVVCEPSRAPTNGKPVVAKYVSEEVQLRIYHKLPTGKIRLAPVNPVYPTIEYEARRFLWIYPVKELIRSF